MKRLITFFLFYVSTHAHCANWTEAGKGIFVDIDSITSIQEYVSYMSLENMTTMGLNSVVIRNKADCSAEKITQIKAFYYGQPMGQGELVDEKTITKDIVAKQNSPAYVAMRFVCKQAQ